MKIGDLEEGKFAITEEGMGVLALSSRSFVPHDQEIYANVVHLANGIGCFLKSQRCRECSKEEAFAAAKVWG
jgi:hypothetical protein